MASSSPPTQQPTWDSVLSEQYQALALGPCGQRHPSSHRSQSCKGLPGPRPELLHDRLTLLLGHVSVHGRHGEIGFSHFLRQPVNLQSRSEQEMCSSAQPDTCTMAALNSRHLQTRRGNPHPPTAGIGTPKESLKEHSRRLCHRPSLQPTGPGSSLNQRHQIY